MLTHLTIRNFKRFESVDFELANPVVLIGPNNSGKTSALQALALWDIGLRRWNEKRTGRVAPEKRPGVTINRKDLIAIPVPEANLLWRDLHVRDVQRKQGGRQVTKNVRVEIIVDGVTDDRSWKCGLEFDYANDESIYCRPLRESDEKDAQRMAVPKLAGRQTVAFLPPMSGLAASEPKWEQGRINVLIGEGQTAQMLRNLCHSIAQSQKSEWNEVRNHIKRLFGVDLMEPNYIAERGEITMSYKEPSGVSLDLSASGRGLQQTLLLLAYIYANPDSVLLLDEPDAHLEMLRQREIYRLISDCASERGSQIIAASHSEVVLNEAAGRDLVIAFVGQPHPIDERGSQVRKALAEIGFDQYYQAEESGWVLYLEGSTDLAILQTLASRLQHPVAEHLGKPFVCYVANQPSKARDHFFGLREAKTDLRGIAVFDRLDIPLQRCEPLQELTWQRREIENYLCFPEVLEAYARESADDGQMGGLFSAAEAKHRTEVMRQCIKDQTPPIALGDLSNRFWRDVKATDDYLDPIFEMFFQRLELPTLLRKGSYHKLASLVPIPLIDQDITVKFDAILKTAENAVVPPVHAD